MLLSKLAAYLKQHSDSPNVHVVRQWDAGESESTPAQAEPTYRPAEIVEDDGTLAVFSVEPAGQTSFTHFVDGIQRTHIPIYITHVPVLYGYAAAALRQRNSDRRMSTWDRLESEALYFPQNLIDPKEMKSSGIGDLYDTSPEVQKEKEELPLHLLDAARKCLQQRREELEIELAKRWAEKESHLEDRWLLVDGSLTGAHALATNKRMVGLIKSHQTQYFRLEEQRKILSLAPGERSSVFETLGARRTPVYTWYLRLHSNAGRDVYFGLIRVEAAKSEETSHSADKISSWILAERAPLSLPDGRWDRMLYPIRDCEEYCRSLAPSQVSIQAALAGL